jgi:hypothetical protein
MIESKHFIKNNVKQVNIIETQVKTCKSEQERLTQISICKANQTPKGQLPKYLIQRKKEDELERQKT